MTPSYVNHRRDARAALALQVVDKRAGSKAVTRDISRRGMFIQTAKPLELGTRFVLNLTIPGCEVPLEISAEVIRREPSGMAVVFIHGGEAQRAYFEGQVTRLVSQHQH
jgi:type IV pilus assembly protein PilZ